MDTKKLLLFLKLLNRETSGHEREIAELYQRALDENNDVVRLRRLLEECEFYSSLGRELSQKGTMTLKEIYKNPDQAAEILLRIRQIHERIDRECSACTERMLSPRPFPETITVLKQNETSAYMRALRMIASVCVYLLVLYEGPQAVQTLSWSDEGGIRERISAVNTKFLPALSRVKRPDVSWVIRKRPMGGRALLGGDCFFLSYEDTKYLEALCRGLRKEPIGTHAFLNVDAYESGACVVPYCWGIGNLVSAGPDQALLFLKRSAVTKLRSPGEAELQKKLPPPFACMRILTDGELFCLSPDELLLGMNQWQAGHEIEERKRTHSCLFCGKTVRGGRLVCPGHFTAE